MVTKHQPINITVQEFVFLVVRSLEDWHIEADYQMKQIVTEFQWKLENVQLISKQDSFAGKEHFLRTPIPR